MRRLWRSVVVASAGMDISICPYSGKGKEGAQDPDRTEVLRLFPESEEGMTAAGLPGKTEICRACPGQRYADGKNGYLGAKVGASAVGVGLLVLAVIFGFLNGLPWESKGAIANLREQVQRESDLRWNDVRERLGRIEYKIDDLEKRLPKTR